MSEIEVLEAVIAWLKTVTELTVIKAHQSGDRPDNPYMMVNFLNVREVNDNHAGVEYAEEDYNNSEGNPQISVTPVIETEWEFSIHSYGDSPTAPLRKVRSISRIDGPQQQFDRNLSIFNIGTINNVPDFIKNAWEPRAHCLIQIRGYTRDGFLIDVIDQAPINVTTK